MLLCARVVLHRCGFFLTDVSVSLLQLRACVGDASCSPPRFSARSPCDPATTPCAYSWYKVLRYQINRSKSSNITSKSNLSTSMSFVICFFFDTHTHTNTHTHNRSTHTARCGLGSAAARRRRAAGRQPPIVLMRMLLMRTTCFERA